MHHPKNLHILSAFIKPIPCDIHKVTISIRYTDIHPRGNTNTYGAIWRIRVSYNWGKILNICNTYLNFRTKQSEKTRSKR